MQALSTPCKSGAPSNLAVVRMHLMTLSETLVGKGRVGTWWCMLCAHGVQEQVVFLERSYVVCRPVFRMHLLNTGESFRAQLPSFPEWRIYSAHVSMGQRSRCLPNVARRNMSNEPSHCNCSATEGCSHEKIQIAVNAMKQNK